MCYFLVAFSVGSVKERGIIVKFCFQVRNTAEETHNMLREVTVALSQTMTYEWLKHSKNRRISTDDDERSRRILALLSEPLNAQIKNIIPGNRRLSAGEVSE
jgi:hypothetical protein